MIINLLSLLLGVIAPDPDFVGTWVTAGDEWTIVVNHKFETIWRSKTHSSVYKGVLKHTNKGWVESYEANSFGVRYGSTPWIVEHDIVRIVPYYTLHRVE